MLSDLTEDEQKNIRNNITMCYCGLALPTYKENNCETNKEKINKCIEDQKIIPRIIKVMICNLTNLIKPISQMIIQYIGPLHSYLFEIILKDLARKQKPTISLVW